jgi:xanthosine utilization system XapX-like protein
MIFTIIIGVSKFNLDKHWIKHIVSIRSRSAITITFDNLLSENYYSTSNLPEIVLMFLQNVNSGLITNELLNSTINKINENTGLFNSKSDFQILCAIHAYNSIILLKQAPEGSEIQLLKTFNSRFVKRTKLLSWVLQSGILIGLIYGLLKIPIYSPETIEIINKYNFVFTILGALGITFLGNQLTFISKKTHELTMILLGYPTKLLKNEKKE